MEAKVLMSYFQAFIRTNSKNSELDDKCVKQRIVGKYGFVDQAEDNRYHRPMIKKDVSNENIKPLFNFE